MAENSIWNTVEILHPQSDNQHEPVWQLQTYQMMMTYDDDISEDDDFIERITHNTADIHEMIRRRDHNKVKHILSTNLVITYFKFQLHMNRDNTHISPNLDYLSPTFSNESSNKSSVSNVSNASYKSSHLSVPSLMEQVEPIASL